MGHAFLTKPYYEFTVFSTGLIMIVCAVFTCRKIYKGSQNTFAFTLIMFTLGYGVNAVADFFIHLFPFTYVQDGETIHTPYIKPNATNFCFYYLLSLQSWIFLIKYLESSLIPISERNIRIILWSVTITYSAAIISIYCIQIIQFPGFNKDGEDQSQFIAWHEGAYIRSYNAQSVFWLILNLISSIFAIIALLRIFFIIKRISKNNENMDVNRKVLILHASLLSS